ncbi:universal stress protein [Modestobacter marinus]|uniref:universal stress protein n=1 Tax=Modestobacter marinus TaxID=477641 RepID=UPI001C94BE79|nr:universal stress protein [Modestobacter marinus]
MTEGTDVQSADDGVVRIAQISGGVLVGHDGSEGAEEALQWAAALAARAGWPLHVLRAWRMTTAPQPASWEFGYVPPLPDYEKAVREELEARVAAAHLDPTLSVTCHVTQGSPARGLIESAVGADLLVVGARGLGGFAGLVLGSVSDQCVRHAPCPVTVVRSRD